ncbi:MCM3AP [Bugula neritina]|uniref:MCM3AP n=1 Tax=Bugula neritina TaxID=10212 RepID=A0A7J7J8H7_BUGNE|nr:MCM3AP [Bugula neritina]
MEKSPGNGESNRTLLCKNIPSSILKRQVLKEHFSQFGEVTKVLVNVERNTAAVEFATHQQAATARNLGTKIHSHDVILTWRKFSTRSNSQDGGSHAKKPTSSGLFGKALESAVGRKPPESTRKLSFPNPSQREAVREGLYDDLPPPGDWNEDDITPISAAKRNPWSHKKKDTSATEKPFSLFGRSREAATSNTGWPPTSNFSNNVVVKPELLEDKSKLFAPGSQNSAQPASSVFQVKNYFSQPNPRPGPGSVTATGAGVPGKSVNRREARSGPSLFGKPAVDSGAAGSKFLFGKPAIQVQSPEDSLSNRIPETTDTASTEGRRSVSPSSTFVWNRLSPAPPGGSRSSSPAALIPTTVPIRASPLLPTPQLCYQPHQLCYQPPQLCCPPLRRLVPPCQLWSVNKMRSLQQMPYSG